MTSQNTRKYLFILVASTTLSYTYAGNIDVLSFQCAPNSAYYSAKVTIENASDTQLDYPRVYVRFNRDGADPLVEDVPVFPRKLPAGAIGTATVIGADHDGKAYTCSLLRVQDSGGEQIN